MYINNFLVSEMLGIFHIILWWYWYQSNIWRAPKCKDRFSQLFCIHAQNLNNVPYSCVFFYIYPYHIQNHFISNLYTGGSHQFGKVELVFLTVFSPSNPRLVVQPGISIIYARQHPLSFFSASVVKSIVFIFVSYFFPVEVKENLIV